MCNRNEASYREVPITVINIVKSQLKKLSSLVKVSDHQQTLNADNVILLPMMTCLVLCFIDVYYNIVVRQAQASLASNVHSFATQLPPAETWKIINK